MEYLNVFLVSIGGSATVLLVVGFLSKSLIAHLFAKEMESYRQKLNYENSAALEAMKIELKQNVKNEDRVFEYEQVMKRYQGPLLHAVYDLQSRLYNIIVQDLVQAYLVNGNENEQEYVKKNTVFVIAQYFAWTEIIRKEIQFIDFRSSQNTKELSELRDNIYRLWQTDSFHDLFRIWAGEQRAIGELMIEHHNDRMSCIGYASFLKKLSSNHEPLFDKLQGDVVVLSKSGSNSYSRLAEIQHSLIDILNYLDPDYIRFPKERRNYVPVNADYRRR